jgi:hypothetical protein
MLLDFPDSSRVLISGVAIIRSACALWRPLRSRADALLVVVTADFSVCDIGTTRLEILFCAMSYLGDALPRRGRKDNSTFVCPIAALTASISDLWRCGVNGAMRRQELRRRAEPLQGMLDRQTELQ